MRLTGIAATGAAAAVGCGQVVSSAAEATRTKTTPIKRSVVHVKQASHHYRLIWHTEFNGRAGSQPDPSDWQLLTGSAGNQELENYTRRPGNVSFNGHGDLAITARVQRTFANGQEWHYTAGKLQTLGRFHVKYGRIEARIRVPAGTGIWPAFWMMGTNYPSVGWPNAGELDILEMQGAKPRELVGTIHGPATYSPNGWQINAFYHSAAPLDNAFHVYAMDWSPNQIVWSIDGHRFGAVTRSELGRGEQWVFNHPYYLILNLSVGGYFVGPPNASTRFPATMLVDWVRVYS